MLNFPKDLTIFDQTDQLIIGGLQEKAYLYIIADKTEVPLGEYYGNPTSGIISHDNSWAVIGGYEGFSLWTPHHITHHELSFVHDFRQISPTQCYILTDPWDKHSSIYQFDIPTLTLNKITPFTDYLDKPYTEHVIW